MVGELRVPELELRRLIEDQLKDLKQGSRQWPEHEVVASLDAVIHRDERGGAITLADYISQ